MFIGDGQTSTSVIFCGMVPVKDLEMLTVVASSKKLEKNSNFNSSIVSYSLITSGTHALFCCRSFGGKTEQRKFTVKIV